MQQAVDQRLIRQPLCERSLLNRLQVLARQADVQLSVFLERGLTDSDGSPTRPADPSDFGPPDVIGLYAVDDPSNTALWTTTSGVGDRFSAQFEAPLRPGVYDGRYHMLSQYLLAKVGLVVR